MGSEKITREFLVKRLLSDALDEISVNVRLIERGKIKVGDVVYHQGVSPDVVVIELPAQEHIEEYNKRGRGPFVWGIRVRRTCSEIVKKVPLGTIRKKRSLNFYVEVVIEDQMGSLGIPQTFIAEARMRGFSVMYGKIEKEGSVIYEVRFFGDTEEALEKLIGQYYLKDKIFIRARGVHEGGYVSPDLIGPEGFQK